MNNKLFLSLKGRMLVAVGAAVLVGLGLVVAIVTRETTITARRDAVARAEADVGLLAGNARLRLEGALDVGRTLAQALAGLAEASGHPSRVDADAMMRRTLAGNPDFVGVWTVWEPDAFDGRDRDFAGKPGHDATGRYLPYWNRASGTIEVEPIKDYTTEGVGDFYLLPKRTGHECVLEPYAYEVAGRSVLMTSLVVPMTAGDGRFLGVAGVDISLESLRGELKALNVEGSGYAALVSNGGLYVAHPKSERAGKPMLETDPWVKPWLAKIGRGEGFVTESESTTLKQLTYRLASPVVIGNTGTAWSAVITLPEDDVLAPAVKLRNHVLATGGMALAGVLLVVWWLSVRLARPIQRIVGEVQLASEQVASASDQLSAASQGSAQAASEQAASVEETSASCEEMAGMTRRNAEHAAGARELAAEARAAADAGAGDMGRMAVAMNEIKEASGSVAKIVGTIEEIAFQTNILALNAAVEAARAGEAGAGFAVVAEEVRNLAQRSAQAARESSGTIENAIRKSEQGCAIGEGVAGSLGAIAEKVRRVHELMAEIASASEEQKQGIGQMNLALGQIDQANQRNAAGAEETAGASEELSANATAMKTAADRLLAIVEGSSAGGRPAARETRNPAVRSAPGQVKRRMARA